MTAAGLSVLKIELDDGTGTFPFNITTKASLTAGLSLERGRRDEETAVDASVLRLTLDNRDGRFTRGSAMYGCFGDQRLRISEKVGAGSYVTRFTGYVQSWPLRWGDGMGKTSPMSITVVDRLSRFGRRTLPSSLAAEQLVDAPAFQYALGEASGATAFGDTSGNTNRPLRIVGSGNALVAGTDVGVDQTAVTFAAGTYLSQTRVAATAILTLEAAFVGTVGNGELATVETSGISLISLYVDAGGTVSTRVTGTLPLINDVSLTSPGTVLDGTLHLIAVRRIGNAAVLLIDGVEVASGSSAGLSALSATAVTAGSGLHDSVFGVTGYTTSVTTPRLAAHYYALGVAPSGESSDARITRLAAYAGLTGSDLALEAGVLTNTAGQSTAGLKLLDTMQSVVTAEGGVLFIRPDGKLVMQNRTHRIAKATGAAAATLTSGTYEHDDILLDQDRQYLFNTVTVTRRNGATQTAVNAASVAQFDSYPDDLSDLLVTTDDEALDRANWQATMYGVERDRLSTVTVDMKSQTAALQAALLAVEIGDHIAVTGLPSQARASSVDEIVEGFSESWSATSWTLTFNTAPAALFQAWVLGDATYGVLDATTRLYF